MPSSNSGSRKAPAKRALPRRNPAQPSEAESVTFLSEREAVSALVGYLKQHPKTRGITLSLRGQKVEVKPLPRTALGRKGQRLEVAPPGFFADLYSAEEIAEDNRLSAHSVAFDLADLPE